MLYCTYKTMTSSTICLFKRVGLWLVVNYISAGLQPEKGVWLELWSSQCLCHLQFLMWTGDVNFSLSQMCKLKKRQWSPINLILNVMLCSLGCKSFLIRTNTSECSTDLSFLWSPILIWHNHADVLQWSWTSSQQRTQLESKKLVLT